MTTKADLNKQDAEYAEGWGIDPAKTPRAKVGRDEFTDAAIESGLEAGDDSDAGLHGEHPIGEKPLELADAGEDKPAGNEGAGKK